MQGGVKVVGLREVIRDLHRIGVEADDLKTAFSRIAATGARLASAFAPKRTGRLAASVKGNKAKSKAVIRSGSARVPYAGAINYGWPRRGIEPAHFMQKADRAIEPEAIRMLEDNLNQLIRERGLK